MEPQAETAHAWLEAENGTRTPIRGACFLGRSPAGHVVLPDDRVSRRHAVIQKYANGEYWLIDLGSSNGTYRNGRRVVQPQRLVEGDTVKLGNHLFAFRSVEGGAPLAEPHEKGPTVLETTPARCWLLVADIAGSTRLLQSLGPDEGVRVTSGWLSACKEIVDGHGGAINKFLGDGFFAYWIEGAGTPAAVCGALRALAALQDGRPPEFRLAVHHGEVSIGGGASLGEDSLMGDAVNFAFRMEKLAGSLRCPRLLSGEAAQRLDGVLPLAERGRHAVASFDGEFPFFTF